MIRNFTLVVATIAAIFLVGSGIFLLLQTPPPAEPESIVIGMPALEQSALIYVAMDRGLFEKNGLSVAIRDDYPTGVGPVQDMADGKLDLSVSAEYPVIVRILSGKNISIIATVDKYQNEALISRKDLGVRNISGLKGRKIGLPRGTILEFFLGRLLEREGMSIGDVVLVDLNASEAAEALVNGKVDAVMYFQPHTSVILGRVGENAISWPGQSDQLLYGVLTARNDWIRENPATIERFLLSLEEARLYSLNHPEEVRSIVKKHLNVTDEYLATVWPDHQFTLSLEQSLLLAMNDEARWMAANNLSPSSTHPDFRNSISTEGLVKVKPQGVNIR